MRPLVQAGARLLASRAGARLARTDSGPAEQERALGSLLPPLARASHWRRRGVEPDLPYGRFRTTVPLCVYEDLAPAIRRMTLGEPDVLWPGRCGLYALTSGTTAGPTKHLPVTAPMLAHFRQAGLDSLLYYAARERRASVFGGRHLMLGGSASLARLAQSGSFSALGGDLSGIAACNLPGWVERWLYEPGPEIAAIADWPRKIEAIARRTLGRDIRLLAGIPSWILVFAAELRRQAGRPTATLRELWPHLECLVHGGVPLDPFRDELRQVLGPGVAFHEVYPASEGFIAAQDADPGDGLRLLTGAGLFFEFLPMSEWDETRVAELGSRAVPLAGVRTDTDYALVLTTPAGLVRYVIGDVVRFRSVAPPRIAYVGRTRLQLSAFGEHVIEREATEAVTAACRGRGAIVNFHVAPLFAPAPDALGRHEWWVELRSAGAPDWSAPVARELDATLRRLNADYDAKRAGGGLEEPVVRLVRPGLFEDWLKKKGRWGGQAKMPRCRSDRQIADELARLNS